MAVIGKICFEQIHKSWYYIEQNFLESLEREINLNADQKRLWFEKIRNVNDKRLIDSMAINLILFLKRIYDLIILNL